MQNVQMKVEGSTLVIRVNLEAPRAPSKSGKSEIVATTQGNASVPGTDLKIGLNIYAPAHSFA